MGSKISLMLVGSSLTFFQISQFIQDISKIHLINTRPVILEIKSDTTSAEKYLPSC